MEILGMDHVGIVTGDLERSCRFYCDTLGFARGQTRVDEQLGLSFAYLTRDGATFELLEPRDRSSMKEGLAHVAFLCRDIHGAFSELKAQGAALLHREVQVHGELSLFFFKSPDAVLVELMERRGE